MNNYSSEKNIHKLKDFLKKRKDIAAVYLFGSKAEETATHLSDLDLAVLFDKNYLLNPGKEKMDLLYQISKIINDCDVDIHILQTSSNLPFVQQVFKHGKVIVENDMEQRFDFEDLMKKKIFDFQPVVNAYLNAMNQRLKEGTYGYR